MKKTVKPKLPSGFKAINAIGNSWKPEKFGDSIEGIMAGVKSVEVKRGRGTADVNVYSIKLKDGGNVDVWESAGLRALQNIKKGKPVYIEYTGKRVIKKGQQPMREFTVATK